MGFFGTIFEPIENLLHVVLQALYNVTDLAGFGSYGVAIILLTILIKMMLYPLTVKQVKSMKAMQELSPHGRDYLGNNETWQADRMIHIARFSALDAMANDLIDEALSLREHP